MTSVEPYFPWGNDDYQSWYYWMTRESGMQTMIWNMKAADAMSLYCVMVNAVFRVHSNYKKEESST